ncbi:tyrosine-type recombinase/integrase [Kitasatospora sp. NPDC054795]
MHPTLLTAVQAQAILDACTRLRDRFLLALLWGTGIRIGEALGLRHEDPAVAEGESTVTPRVNDNRSPDATSGRPGRACACATTAFGSERARPT